jgi:Ca2+-binding RTX toxin-like protein
VRFTGIAGLDGSPRSDILVGDDGPNVLRGGPGGDLLGRLGGPDVLDGQAGPDRLLGDRQDTCTGGVPIGCGPVSG